MKSTLRVLKHQMLIFLFILLVLLQGSCKKDAAQESERPAQELPPDQFYHTVIVTIKASDLEGLEQLIKTNPATAEQMAQDLTRISRETAEGAFHYEDVALILRKLITGDATDIQDIIAGILAFEDFYQEFTEAMQSIDIERLYTLITENAELAETIRQKFAHYAELPGEKAARYNALAGLLEELLEGDFGIPFGELRKEGEQAAETGDYATALQKWQIGLEYARLLEDKKYISAFLGNIGEAAERFRQYEEAITYHQEALQIHRKIGDMRGEGAALLNIGKVYEHWQQLPQALEFYQQAREVIQELKDRPLEITIIGDIGTIHTNLEEHQQALDVYQQGLQIARDIGDAYAEAAALCNIGLAYDKLEQYQNALEPYQNALNLFREMDDPAGKATALNGIGNVYRGLGQYQHALDAYKQGVELAQTCEDSSLESVLLGNLGVTLEKSGHYQEALEAYQKTATISREVGDLTKEGEALIGISNMYRHFGYNQQSLEAAQQVLTITSSLNDWSLQREALTNIGIAYHTLGQYQEALEYHEKALMITREHEDRDGEAGTLHNMGLIYEGFGQYETALELYQQVLKIYDEIGEEHEKRGTLKEIGHIYTQTGQYQQALEYYQRALDMHRALHDKPGEVDALTGIGNVYWMFGRYQEAIDLYQQGLLLARDVNDFDGQGNALNNLGVIYHHLGQYQQASDRYQQALVIARNMGDRRGEAEALGNIGILQMSLGQYQQALQSLKQELAIAREFGYRRLQEGTQINLGATYDSLGQYQLAVMSYQEALTMAHSLKDVYAEELALNNIGGLYTKCENFDLALSIHQQALKIARETGNLRGEGDALNGIGLIHKRLGQFQQALAAFQQSLQIYERLGILDALWEVRRRVAAVEAQLNHIESAITHYEQALDTIEQLLSGVTEKEQKLLVKQERMFAYDEFINFLHQLSAHQRHDEYERKTLEVFERKQGRLFLEEMGQSGARLFGDLPEDLFQREFTGTRQLQQIRAQLIRERSKRVLEQNQEAIQHWAEQEQTLLEDLTTLQRSIETNYPDYYALRYPKPVSLADLQQHVLQSGELMVVYGVMQEHTLLWFISNREFSLVSLKITEKELQHLIEEFRATPDAIIQAIDHDQQLKAIRLIHDTLDDMTQQGYTLYQRLFPESVRPLIAANPTLYIIPTGPLYGLPFEALITQTSEEDGHFQYLVQDHSITYLSSSSLLKILRESQARRKRTVKYPLLAFANPVYDEDTRMLAAAPPRYSEPALRASIDTIQEMREQSYLTLMGGMNFAPLPETEAQARAIANVLNAPQVSEALQLEEQASKQNVFRFNEQQRLDDYRYILFSAHAVLPGDIDHIRQPAIVLSYPEQDGYLTMADVFSLQLNADLVVLSACNTGRGRQIRGEGIMGLTRAFMYAGTPTVGVTLWSVDSQASYEINTRFFQHLKEGKPIADALRQAKLNLLAAAEEDEDLEHFRHPFFWAPFVVFGDGGE